MSADPRTCEHVWVASGGEGDPPSFRAIAGISGQAPVAYVRCQRCSSRTWLTREQWKARTKPEPPHTSESAVPESGPTLNVGDQ